MKITGVLAMLLPASALVSIFLFVKRTNKRLNVFTLLLVVLMAAVLGCEEGDTYSFIQGGNSEPRVEVLLYHSLEPGGSDEWPVIDPALFYRQIELLLAEGWEPLTLTEYKAWAKGKTELACDSFLLTFDDGARSIYEYAFPFLLEKRIPAAVFLIAKHHDPHYEPTETIWVPKLTDEQIMEMQHSGLVTFQSHSYDLHRIVDDEPAALTASADQIIGDLLKSAEVISNLTGEDVYSIAYPYGAFNCTIVDAAQKAGFRLGFVLGEGEEGDKELLQNPRISLDNYSLEEFKEFFNLTIRI